MTMGLWKDTWDNMLKGYGVDPAQYEKRVGPAGGGTGHSNTGYVGTGHSSTGHSNTGYAGTGGGKVQLGKYSLDENVFRALLENFMSQHGRPPQSEDEFVRWLDHR